MAAASPTDPPISEHGHYKAWIDRVERPARRLQLERLRRERPAGADEVLLTLVLALDSGGAPDLTDTLDSLRAQTTGGFRLLLVSPAGADNDARSRIEALAHSDTRFRCWHPGTAVELPAQRVDTPYVALLRPGDRLAPEAVELIGAAVGAARGPALIYSDHDLLDRRGRRCAPCFKPAWDPVLFRSRDYLSPLCLLRRDRFLGDGGLPLEEKALYQWLQRQLEKQRGDRISHIPHVLCHRRYGSGVTDGAEWEGKGGPTAPSGNMDPPLVTVVVPLRDRLELTRRCVEGVLQQTDYPSMELILVDNDSAEPATRRWLGRMAGQDRVRVLRVPGPFNYARLNNLAVEQAGGEVLALLNNDLEILHSSWLRSMVVQALEPGCGAVGARLLYPDRGRGRRIQHAGVVLGMRDFSGHPFRHLRADSRGCCGLLQQRRTVSAVTGACLVVTRERYLEAGGMDEQGLAVSFNDIDLCLRLAEQGYRNIYLPEAELLHHESASRGHRHGRPDPQLHRELETMIERWGERLRDDPCYNPNLSHLYEDCRLPLRPERGRWAATPPLVRSFGP